MPVDWSAAVMSSESCQTGMVPIAVAFAYPPANGADAANVLPSRLTIVLPTAPGVGRPLPPPPYARHVGYPPPSKTTVCPASQAKLAICVTPLTTETSPVFWGSGPTPIPMGAGGSGA